ncbi:MAG: PilN domain-containing protein [Pseudomonadota bacterium]
MTQRILGLDIGLDFLDGVVIERSLNGYRVVNSAGVPMTVIGTPARDNPDSDSSFETALVNLTRVLDVTGCTSCAVALSGMHFSFRTVFLPFSSPGKIRQVLPFELASHLPFQDCTYVSDFLVSSPAAPGEPRVVFTASAPETVVDTYFTPLETMGFKPSLITPRGYAAAAFIIKNFPSQDRVAFVDMENLRMTLILSRGNHIIFVRCPGQADGTPETTAQLFRQSLILYNQIQGTDFTPDRCIIISRDHADESLIRSLSSCMDCPVHKFQLPESLKRSAPDDETLSANASGAAVMALESRNLLNLCQGRYRADSFVQRHTSRIITAGVLMVLAFIVGVFGIYRDCNILSKRILAVDGSSARILTATFPQINRVVDPLMQMTVAVNQARDASRMEGRSDDGLSASSPRIMDILTELSTRIPGGVDVEISRLLVNPGRIIISGSTDTFNTVDKVKSYLEGSSFFSQVSISSASADKTGNRIRFQCIVDLKG